MRQRQTGIDRRQFLATAAALAAAPALAHAAPQRVVIIMCDGFGPEYLEQSAMPVFGAWRRSGIFKLVEDAMPSVTNTNNASICCGAWPDVHGITGNSYLDDRTGREEYMESADLVMAPTLFQRAAKQGVKSALLSSKKKTTTLLPAGADVVLTAEEPTPEWKQRLGAAPDIYSREINYWLMTAAIDLLKRRSDLGVIYIHTTDYPMHTWPAEAPESKEHLAKLDQLIGEAAAAAPDAAFLWTGDHGMNHKTRCWDLLKACDKRGTPIRMTISVDNDRYVKHHKGYGGAAWVYCNTVADTDRVAATLQSLEGVEAVLTRSEAAAKYRLMASRIGDLVVLGDRDTVFGELDVESEPLPPEYRTHGSLHERQVPLLIHNVDRALSADDFQHNFDLARWLYT